MSSSLSFRPRPRRHRLTRIALRVLVVLLLVLALLVVAAWAAVRASLPQLDGAITLPGLQAPATITRDALGTAVLQTTNRQDLARALGYVHAQERYFEMDLTRRSAAGELSALFGAVALDRDKARRAHRLRVRLSQRLAQMPAADQALLQAYAAGVNAGLAALPLRPWQYLLLRAQPARWDAVDSLLVGAEMFWTLQGSGWETAFQHSLLRERAGDALANWLMPQGGRWDAALDGSSVPTPALPGPEVLDLRAAKPTKVSATTPDEAPMPGSNQWAVAGSRTADGTAVLASDMHLSLSVPNIWYRAQFQVGPLRAAGLTLPGLPVLIVGSNGHVAWGFTNAAGQWFDWIKLATPLPAERLRRFEESIEIKGAAPQTLSVEEFDGDPILKDVQGQRYALRWVLHRGDALGLELDGLLGAQDTEAALAVAQRAGMPHQNFMGADSAGHIAWTIAGRLWSQPPRAQNHARFQPPGQPPHTWLAPQDYPVIRDPADGQLWTANNRQLGGAAADVIGDGGQDNGARARQIRDRLAERVRHDEASIGAIHLDDEARYMQSWGQRLKVLVQADPGHAAVAEVLHGWNGRADADQAGYRLVRNVRLRTLDALWRAWTTPALGPPPAEEKDRIQWRPQFEASATQALDEKPAHLLPPGHASFDALVLAQLDAVVQEMTQDGRQSLAAATWGQQNASRVQHVLSRAIPPLSRLLDMPVVPQGGDSYLPHVSRAAFGQSERLVVAPGHEERATLSMPGGQSGHPLSPFYGAGHRAWQAGEATPLLAGPALHQLQASPAPP